METITVARREAKDVDSSIFSELQSKYGGNEFTDGVKYKQDLEYYSIDVSDLNDSRFMDIAMDFPECGTVYMLLRMYMLPYGFYLPYSQLDEKHLIRQMKLWVDDEERIRKIIQKFIDMELLVKVTNLKGVPCLIELHQLFNYELNQKKRKEERERKRDYRAAQKKNTATMSNAPETSVAYTPAPEAESSELIQPVDNQFENIDIDGDLPF